MATIRRMKYTDDAPAEGQPVEYVHIEDLPSGGGEPAGTATTSTPGLVKQAAAVADVSAADAAVAAAETVTKAEFDAVVALTNADKATLNALLAACRAAGILAS